MESFRIFVYEIICSFRFAPEHLKGRHAYLHNEGCMGRMKGNNSRIS